jgi:ribonuclease BN (tRNA processing enzyme)
MRVTVLGSAASYPGPFQACSGYLVELDGTSILIDCGSGVLANLGRLMDPTRLDAVVVSHRHPDHWADVLCLQAALRYAPEGPMPPLPFMAPRGLADQIRRIYDERSGAEFDAAFDVTELAARTALTIGAVELTPMPVDHVPDTYAMRIAPAAGGACVCYTADTRFGSDVLAAAAGCAVLIAEATLPTRYAGRAPHMTPVEAGELAARSGARMLVLGHLWPTADRDELLGDARQAFDGEIQLAY